MLFNSYIFILLFLPLALLGWHFLNYKRLTLPARLFLTGMSLWFYGWFNIKYLPLIIISILVNYTLYRGMRAYPSAKKLLLFAGILLNLGLLFYYKYYDFFVENIRALTGREPALKGLILPLGISFFTFQQLGFLIDSYKGYKDSYSFDEYALFIAFFPQLVAGPIVTHREMVGEFRLAGEGSFKPDYFAAGLFSFNMGLGKKVLIADVLGRAVDIFYGSYWKGSGKEGGTLLALIVISAYSLQLYFDFSGYCDMARALGLMFGVRIPDNFDSPYKSQNIAEFWRRWHITLGRFFTTYVYIPLGGSRVGFIRTCINLMVVFLLSGIWHGAGWTFVIWGLLHGLFVVLHRVFKTFVVKEGEGIKALMPLNIFLTVTLISLLWVVFRAGSPGQAIYVFKMLRPAKQSFALIPRELYESFRVPEFFYLLKLTGAPAQSLDMVIMTLYMVIPWGICLFAPSVGDITKNFKPDISKAVFSSLIFIWALVSLSGVSSFLYFNF